MSKVTLAQSLSQTLTEQLLSKLPAALATEYGLEADAVSTFLSTFLAAQLPAAAGKAGKAKKERSPSPKGDNGKGRTNAFMLFSQEERSKVIEAARAAGDQFYKQKNTGEKQKDENGKAKVIWADALDAAGQRIPVETMPQHIVASRVGERWRALSAEAKAEWTAKAVAVNTANGLPPAEKSPKPKAAVAVAKTAAAPAAAAAAKTAVTVKTVAAAEGALCPFTLTRGPRKDKPCGAKVKAGEKHCSKHNAADE